MNTLTLNISFIIYFIWLMPQIFLNFKRKNVRGLSIFLHGILCIGYLCDLIYGVGREMQWQYRVITFIGLLSLSLQHYQFWCYGLRDQTEKMHFYGLTMVCLLLAGYALFILLFHPTFPHVYINAGIVAQVCWLSYAIPQIFRNAVQKNTAGLSAIFVFLSITLNMCDLTSAWNLNWDYPSRIGPIFLLAQNMILLFQIFYYQNAVTHDENENALNNSIV